MTVRRLTLAEGEEHDPLRELLGMFIKEGQMGGTVRMHSDLTWEPPTDVIETAEEIIVVVDIAGMSGEDITVVTDGTVLKIGGTRPSAGAPGRKQFHKLEIQVGPFEREIELPVRVDPSKVSAHYEKGFLRVCIRKLDPSQYVKKVKIE